MSQVDRITNSLDPVFHPASHYVSPEDVLNDAGLSTEEKRVILSCWASDIYVVESQPALRKVPGIPSKLRLDDILRPAIMSGLLSDMLTASLAKHSRTLTENKYHNGHPDLVVRGVYADDSVKSGIEGVEIKTTRKAGGAVDTHGAREQWMCVFVYKVDTVGQPVVERTPMTFTEVYLGRVAIADFRRNDRGELGTRTATLHAAGIEKLRRNWLYRL